MYLQKKNRKLRHEYKYILDYSKYIQLRELLKKVMTIDPNMKNGSGYHVRSLYFDDVYNTALFEKEIGISNRKKYRIRIYDFSDQIIKMEIKNKYQDYTEKQSCNISREQYYSIYDKNIDFLYDSRDEVKKSFYVEIKNKLLKPKVIVDYLREAYILPYNDIRITIDNQLSALQAQKEIFDSNLHGQQVLKNHESILEVKFNNFLPNHIKEILQMYSTNKFAVSKYLLCREYLNR